MTTPRSTVIPIDPRRPYAAVLPAVTSITPIDDMLFNELHGAPLLPYAAGIQSTFGCKLLKNCSNCLTVPGAEKNMFVVAFAPEHN